MRASRKRAFHEERGDVKKRRLNLKREAGNVVSSDAMASVVDELWKVDCMLHAACCARIGRVT